MSSTKDCSACNNELLQSFFSKTQRRTKSDSQIRCMKCIEEEAAKQPLKKKRRVGGNKSSKENPSKEEAIPMDVEEEQFNQAFAELSPQCRDAINDIKNDDSDTTGLNIRPSNAQHFKNLAWQLLGRYIANNTHLEYLDLEYCMINNDAMSSLFGGRLVRSCSLEQLDIRCNTFTSEGMMCMVPFLEISSKLAFIDFSQNDINLESFELLIGALHGRPMKRLHLQNCNITNISALETSTLPNLSSLHLKGNNLGREGCVTLSHLLRKEGTRLEFLGLENNNINDEGAEILANSLENNTKLKRLDLQRNKNISDKGSKAFFVLLNNASSIESAYKSNYTLTTLGSTSWRWGWR